MYSLKLADFNSFTQDVKKLLLDEYKNNCLKYNWVNEYSYKYYNKIDSVINYFMLFTLMSFGAAMYSQYSSKYRYSSNFYFCLGFFIFIDCILIVLQISNKYGELAASHKLVINFWNKLEEKLELKTKCTEIDTADFINLYYEHGNLMFLNPKIPEFVYVSYEMFKSKHNDAKNNININNKYYHSTEKSAIQILKNDTNIVRLDGIKDEEEIKEELKESAV